MALNKASKQLPFLGKLERSRRVGGSSWASAALPGPSALRTEDR